MHMADVGQGEAFSLLVAGLTRSPKRLLVGCDRLIVVALFGEHIADRDQGLPLLSPKAMFDLIGGLIVE